MRAIGWLAFVAVLLGFAAPAQALCIYRGELYGQSTVTGEFRESPLVVRGTVLENRRNGRVG